MKNIRKALHDVFGFAAFRPNQEEIITAILSGRDVFAAMPTGGGKSVCYQLPALLLPGLTVVVSPLVALMKDQVDAAREQGLPAAFLNSTLETGDAAAVYRELAAGGIKLLYISPERFRIPGFAEKLKAFGACFFAVDEAHCLSEWGHDFRPDYLELSGIRRLFPEARIAGFTATATRRVQEDILRLLKLKDPFIVRASFDRPELFYEVAPKEKADPQILAFLRDRPGESGIVYRTSRADVEKTAAYLASKGVKALPYHAGLPAEVREKHQEMFNRDEIRVIVATIAFGMGIDKSNIRFVVHADMPKSMEGYYQETGRAGRDGLDSRCLLLYGPGDLARIRWFIDRMDDEEERGRALGRLRRMADYASVNVCRRKQLLEYFDEPHPGDCGGCDVCTGRAEKVDASEDARMLLSAVLRSGERFGAAHIVDIVTGANTEKIRRYAHDGLKTFGVGKGKSKTHWRGVLGELLAAGCLAQDEERFGALALTGKGREVLYGREPFEALRREEKRPAVRRKSGPAGRSPGGGAVNEGLFERLRILRLEIAAEKNLPPYIIFSDRTLREMCAALPRSRADLLEISGVGGHKLEAYGDQFLTEISRHLA